MQNKSSRISIECRIFKQGFKIAHLIGYNELNLITRIMRLIELVTSPKYIVKNIETFKSFGKNQRILKLKIQINRIIQKWISSCYEMFHRK